MEEKVKEIIGRIKGDPTLAATLPDEANLIRDVGLDSLQLIEFVLQVEEELDVEFDYDRFDYSHLASVSTFCEFISQQGKGDSASP